MIIPSSRYRIPAACGVISLCAGIAVALHYHRLGLTLSHYDARGHLVVARRILDSITPGWQQIGAVWLPLPHLLNALPVQIDAFYRTGASAVAISILAFAITSAAVASIVLSLSGSAWAACGAAAIVALNPNLLYLQSTPMTEPLLFALTTLGIAMLVDQATLKRCTTTTPATLKRCSTAPGIVFALACLTRYEAWPITFTAIGIDAAGHYWNGEPLGRAARRGLAVARFPIGAIVGFTIFSRIVIGQWFVAGGFFVPENPALGHPWLAISQIAWGADTLNGRALAVVAVLGIAAIAAGALWRGAYAHRLTALAPFAGASLPWLAFLQGHPYRIRYMVALVVAEAIAAGIALGLLSRWSRIATAAATATLLMFVVYEVPPLDQRAAMVTEAQWDVPNMAARQHVTACLRASYAGESIMASMGSLGHYMQETSAAGFALSDFLHEGNGDIWLKALEGPRPFAGWILIEEKAEGGDMLAKISRENPQFLDGFSRVCDAAGVTLYQRQNRMLNVAR